MNQGWAYTIKAHPDALEARTPLIAACSYIFRLFLYSRQHYKMNLSKLFLFVLVFVVETDYVESVSVLVGDSVTLLTGLTEIQRDDQIRWKFGDQDADLTC